MFFQQTSFANGIDSIQEKTSGIILSVTSAGTTCGEANGNIIIIATGGTPPYSYSLNGGAPATIGKFLNLTAGSYSILVTDVAGQTANDNVTPSNTFSPPTGVTSQFTGPTGCTTRDASLVLTG